MQARYKHTNLIAADWRSLAKFYEQVFGCVIVPPERHLSGQWLEDGTAVKNASFSGAHLRLAGHGDDGPTLEIYQYSANEPKPPPAANRKGFGHIAFEVSDVQQGVADVIALGGAMLGQVVSHPVEGVGLLTFAYVTDPEGNIVELQSWTAE